MVTQLLSCCYQVFMVFFICISVVTHEEGPRAQDTELDLHNPGHQMSGALCYTTQMVALIAYYLGIVLPKKLQYR